MSPTAPPYADLYIVGKQDVIGALEWELDSIWTDFDSAVDACRQEDYFIAPMPLNQTGPVEISDFDWWCYPNDEVCPGIQYPLEEIVIEGYSDYPLDEIVITFTVDVPESDIYMVGKFVADTESGTVWELDSLWTGFDEAMDKCRDEDYFVAPMPLNDAGPHETTEFDWVCYPKDEMYPGIQYPESDTDVG
jgi:hypothetical protein